MECGPADRFGTGTAIVDTIAHPLPGTDATTCAARASLADVVARSTALPFPSLAEPSEAIATLPFLGRRPCRAIVMSPPHLFTFVAVTPVSHAPMPLGVSSHLTEPGEQNLPSWRTTPDEVPLYVHWYTGS